MRLLVLPLLLLSVLSVLAQDKPPTPQQLTQSALVAVQATPEWAALIKTPAWKVYQEVLALQRAHETAKPKVEKVEPK